MVNFFLENFNVINLRNWLFLLVFLNVYIYVFNLVVFFSILFLIDVSLFKSTANFKSLTQIPFTFNVIVFLFLTLAGLPPFLSFIGKFFLFIFLFNSTNFLLILIFFFFNCFTIYFYVQHLRLFFSKIKAYPNVFKKNFFFVNFHITYLIVFILFFLIFGVFFISDIFVYLTPFIVHY